MTTTIKHNDTTRIHVSQDAEVEHLHDAVVEQYFDGAWQYVADLVGIYSPYGDPVDIIEELKHEGIIS